MWTSPWWDCQAAKATHTLACCLLCSPMLLTGPRAAVHLAHAAPACLCQQHRQRLRPASPQPLWPRPHAHPSSSRCHGWRRPHHQQLAYLQHRKQRRHGSSRGPGRGSRQCRALWERSGGSGRSGRVCWGPSCVQRQHAGHAGFRRGHPLVGARELCQDVSRCLNCQEVSLLKSNQARLFGWYAFA